MNFLEKMGPLVKTKTTQSEMSNGMLLHRKWEKESSEIRSYQGGNGLTDTGKRQQDEIRHRIGYRKRDMLQVIIHGYSKRGNVKFTKFIEAGQINVMPKTQKYLYKMKNECARFEVFAQPAPTVDDFMEEKRPLSKFTTVELLTELISRESQ